jgi:hypothetical protein
LHALAQGTATSDALLELRPHLRNCAGCRATVRALHTSRLQKLTAFAPIAALLEPARVWIERLRGGAPGHGAEPPAVGELHPMDRQQDVEELMRRLNSGEPAVQSAAPAVAESASRLSTVRVNVRGWLEPALQRLQSSDLAMGVHAATTGGGGRITSIAALIGICVSGVGAGTYCVATALLPDPKPAIRREAKVVPRTKDRHDRHAHRAARATKSQTVRLATVTQSEPDSAAAPPRRPAQTRTRVRTPSVRDEFSFETGSSAPPTTSGATSGAASTSAAGSTSNASFETGNAAQRSASRSEFSDGAGGEFSP